MNKIRFASAAMAAVLTFSAGSGLIPQLGNTNVITASAAEDINDKHIGNIIIAQVTANALFYSTNHIAVDHLKRGEKVYVLKTVQNYAYIYCPRLKKYGYVLTKHLKVVR